MKILDIRSLVLSVSLLCILVTTAPTSESDGSSPPTGETVTTNNSTAIKNSTTTTKKETSVAMPTNATTTNTITKGSTSLSHDTKETTPTSQAEKATDGNVPSRSTKHEEKPKPKSARYLLYEIEKDIRSLSLDNVKYIIEMGPDVLAYSLLDKLGYLKEDEDEDDPHLKVIEDNNDKLLAKLEARRKELTPVTKPPLPSTEPPPRVTTTHVVDVAKIKYDIMKRIKALSLAEFDNLLGVYDIDTLPFAVGIQLGYDDESNVDYFNYLGDQGGKELRATLLAEKEKKSNMAPPPPPTPKPEPPKDSSSNEPTGGKNHPDDNKEGGESDHNPEGDINAKLDQPDGQSSNSDGLSDDTAPAGDHNGSNQGPPDNENGGDKGLDNNGQTGTGDNPSRGYPDDNIDGFDAFPGDDGHMGLDGDDEKSKEGGENQEKIQPDSVVGSDADTSENSAVDKPQGGEKEGKGPSQPGGISDNTLEEEDEEYDEYMDEKSGGGFGAWHFLIIFIVIGVAVVIGYLCLHNRKKLREGVESYVSDASKRRRRAREYKPLATT